MDIWIHKMNNIILYTRLLKTMGSADKRISKQCGHAMKIYLTQRAVVITNPWVLPLQPGTCFWLHTVLRGRCVPRIITGGCITSISRVISRRCVPIVMRIVVVRRFGVLLPHCSACSYGRQQHSGELAGKGESIIVNCHIVITLTGNKSEIMTQK
jgi:hypothetical protein